MADILRILRRRTGGHDGSEPAAPPAPAAVRERRWLLVLVAALVLWAWVAIPLAIGSETFYYRDVFDNHLALKAYGAEQLSHGRVPAFDPQLGLGQPFRGNPSALAFYPDNLLYLLLPFWSAYNLHFVLHWLLALGSMAVLGRRLGLGPEAALLAGLTYAGSGFLLSGLAFYNILTVAAWWPLVLAGAVIAGSRGWALGGLACGLALLGGEPLTAALGLAPLLVLAVRAHGLGKGFLRSLAIGLLGLLVAAPQVVATARILGFSFRGNQGVGGLATNFSLHPLRLLEVALPLPFGWPMHLGEQRWWLGVMANNVVFYFSLYVGIVGLWLAVRGLRRRPEIGVLALAGLAGAVLLGRAPELILSLGGGLFRYPEKLVFWWALALPVLAGEGMQRAMESARGNASGGPGTAPPFRGAVVVAGGLLAAALALALLRPWAIGHSPLPRWFAVQSLHWVLYLGIGGLLLLAAAWALRRRAAALVVALQLLALLQLAPLVGTTATAPFREAPDWLERLQATVGREPIGVLHTLGFRPVWEPYPRYRSEGSSPATNYLRQHQDLFPAAGVLHGLTYPLAPDKEGLASPFSGFLERQIAPRDWSQRLPWLRLAGVDALITVRPLPPLPGVRLLDSALRQAAPTFLYQIDDPAPAAWWPQRLEAAPGPMAALESIGRLEDPVATVVAPEGVRHVPGGRVVDLDADGDRIEVAVESEGGGLLVVQRAYHVLYRARIADQEVRTVPVQLTLLGVVVPPGRHRVVIDVDDRPEIVASVLALLTALLLAAVLVRGASWRARRDLPARAAVPERES